MLKNLKNALKHLKYSILYFSVILFGTSCEYINLKNSSDGDEIEKTPIAKVKDVVLYEEDLSGLVSNEVSAEDSANLMNRYVNSWIRKQLLISQASEQINFDQAELDRKILDYRYALMVYEYQKYYVNQNLDTTVTDEEIQTYYNNNLDNFELKQNIIKGYFIKVDRDAPKIKTLRKLIVSDDEKDLNELRSYCFRFAETYYLEDSTWINFDEVITNTPFVSVTNKVQFLKDNTFIEEEDDSYLYFLKIEEYKISDQISPLEFVKENIRQIILNKRKVELTNKLEEEIFERATRDNDYELYTKE